MSEQKSSLVAELVGGPFCGEKLPYAGDDLIRIALGPRQEPPSLFVRVGTDGEPEQAWAVYRRRQVGRAENAVRESASFETVKHDYDAPQRV